jgi:probable phosphoglycerate mutase
VPKSRPLHILLLRHGQTDANATGVLQGHRPTPLNDLGLLQAERLAVRVARHMPRVTAIISSDLRRAEQTAVAVAAACGLQVAFDAGWRERGFGQLEGTHVGQREIWRAAHGDADPPGAESLAGFRARVHEALLAVARDYAGEPAVAVVTHGGPVGIVLRLLADGTLPSAHAAPPAEGVRPGNCSVMELLVQHAGNGQFQWRAACVNDVRHLEDLATETDSG